MLPSDRPPNVVKIIKAVLSRALAECHKHGWAQEDFYQEWSRELGGKKKLRFSQMVNRALDRLRIRDN